MIFSTILYQWKCPDIFYYVTSLSRWKVNDLTLWSSVISLWMPSIINYLKILYKKGSHILLTLNDHFPGGVLFIFMFSIFWKAGLFAFLNWNIFRIKISTSHKLAWLVILIVNFKRNVLPDLAPFVQFKKRGKSHGGVLPLVKFTAPWVLFTAFKLYKWYQIVQSFPNGKFEESSLRR